MHFVIFEKPTGGQIAINPAMVTKVIQTQNGNCRVYLSGGEDANALVLGELDEVVRALESHG